MADSKPTYKVEIEVLGEVWKGKGKSIEEALKDIKVEWQEIMGKGIVRVKKGSKVMEKLYGMNRIRKIFLKELGLKREAKFLELLFNG